MDLIIENVRCFRERQAIPIRPLTFLVGENSTGKSTILAAFQIAHEIPSSPTIIDFNKEPFRLGTYDQIANYRLGRSGRAKHFTIGLRMPVSSSRREPERSLRRATKFVEFSGTFSEGGAQPELARIEVASQVLQMALSSSRESAEIRTVINMGGEERAWTREMSEPSLAGPAGRRIRAIGFFDLLGAVSANRSPNAPTIAPEERRMVEKHLTFFWSKRISWPLAIDPVRSRPERVYSRMEDHPIPSGSHVPMVLARACRQTDAASKFLVDKVREFGEASGLFHALEIKRFGQKEGDPFQILVGDQGPRFSLVDVGYGVSQVLPILVESLRTSRHATLLLQQPEVHLHPRAQAALGSLFVSLAHAHEKRFLIETHSDYILDRVRMEVRDGKGVTADDVIILYFEKGSEGVNIHPIHIDESGNILDPPKGYRNFFMQEEKRYFGG